MGRVDTKGRTVRIERLCDVDSTNAEALRRAASGERGPLWIAAERQLAGRGRRGRQWVSEPGNLYASLLLDLRCEARHAGQVAFVIALALHDAVCALVPAACDALKLKWPNDILLNGCKVAGILIESAGTGGPDLIVIGCGVNCTAHPPDMPYAATDFSREGYLLHGPALLEELAKCFERRLDEWRGGSNFAVIRDAWLARASGVGANVVVRFAEGDVNGTFEDIGYDGRLILRLADGGHRDIFAGDVFFGPPAVHARGTHT